MSTAAVDTLSIQRLMHQYAHRFDAGDIDGFAALFEHGTLDFGRLRPAVTGAPAVRAMIDGLVIMYDGSPRTNHLMHNIIIDVDADGLGASASSYVQILQATDGFPLQIIVTGLYADRFIKDDGVWRFSERHANGSLAGDVSRHLRIGRPSAAAAE